MPSGSDTDVSKPTTMKKVVAPETKKERLCSVFFNNITI